MAFFKSIISLVNARKSKERLIKSIIVCCVLFRYPFFCPQRRNNISKDSQSLTNSAVLNFGLNTITPPRKIENQGNDD